MKKIIFLFILNFFIYTVGYSQSIKGVIKDNTSNTPIKNTVVMLVKSKDSVLYKFARTDANGVFQIKKVDSGTYLLITTHPIFADYTDSLATNTDIDLGTLGITPKAKLLQEVIVKSGSPIKIKGDTTVYTADSFKVKDGANVEDLLRKLPGIQVGKNGEIKAMGETVKNVLVDGEEFFGNDPGMVVKNLQANAVQEVQVYDKKSDQAAFTGIDDGVSEKTINLKLKANRKSGYFGKVEAGGGTPDNYTNSVMLNAFQGKRKISAFGYMSNTGKTELGWDEADKFGGGEREGMTSGIDELSGGMWMSWSDGDSYSGGANGIPKNWNGGLHYSNKYKGDSLNINGSYRYGKINAPGGSSTFSKIYYPDSSWNNNSSNQMFSSKEKHTVSFTIENKLDSNNTIKFVNRGTYNQGISNNTYYEENITTQGDFINNSTRKVNGNTTSKGYNGVLTWNHKFKKSKAYLIFICNWRF
ncbi:MAG: carboxypeptidase regulatory-like domain-containing protein [Chitinophagaceae bacterium]|nr:carboxypeptidase regulatory-like domain-containing protein [Chitinophagaceae bacterium]